MIRSDQKLAATPKGFEAKDGSKGTVAPQVASYDSCLSERTVTSRWAQFGDLTDSENDRGILNREQAVFAESKNNFNEVLKCKPKQVSVFVVDLEGKPCLPTASAQQYKQREENDRKERERVAALSPEEKQKEIDKLLKKLASGGGFTQISVVQRKEEQTK